MKKVLEIACWAAPVLSFRQEGQKSGVWALKSDFGYHPRTLVLISGLQWLFNGFLRLRMVEPLPSFGA